MCSTFPLPWREVQSEDLFLLVDARGLVLAVGMEKGDVWAQARQLIKEATCQTSQDEVTPRPRLQGAEDCAGLSA